MSRERAVWIFVAAVLLFFAPALTTRTLYLNDLQTHFFPIRRTIASLFAHGELPLWNPLIQGGMPLLADPNNLPLYPTLIVWFLTSAVSAFNIEIVAHFIAGGIGAYLLARQLRLGAAPAFAAAVVFTFCGFTLSLHTMENRLFASAWMPWILLFVDRGWLGAAAVAGAIQVLAGAPEAAALTWLLAIAWTASTRKERLLRTIGAAVVAALLAGIQIVPTLSLVQQSMRSGGVALANFWDWSLHPKRLPELIVPSFFGRITGDYWGRTVEDNGSPYIGSIYFGIAALALAIAGSRSRSLSARLRNTLAIATVVVLVLASGRFVFGVRVPPPLIRSFRFPIKALTIAPLTVAMLAAAALDDLQRCRRTATFAALVLGAIAACALAPAFGTWWFGAPAPALPLLALHAVVVAAIFAAAVRIGNASVVVAILIAADLMIAGMAITPTAPRALFTTEPPIVDVVKKHLDGGRLYSDVPHARDPFAKFARLEEYTAAAYGIPVIYHIQLEGLEPLETMAARDLINRVPWPARASLLRASGVSVVLSEQPRPELQAVGSAGAVHVYATGATRPKIAYEIAYESSLRRAIADVAGGVPDVVFARGVPPPRRGIFRVGATGRNSWRVETTAPGFFVMNIPFDRDWIATVDGRSVPTLPADFASSAIPINSGVHEIRMRYAPRSVAVGGLATVIGLIALLLLGRGNRTAPRGSQPSVD